MRHVRTSDFIAGRSYRSMAIDVSWTKPEQVLLSPQRGPAVSSAELHLRKPPWSPRGKVLPDVRTRSYKQLPKLRHTRSASSGYVTAVGGRSGRPCLNVLIRAAAPLSDDELHLNVHSKFVLDLSLAQASEYLGFALHEDNRDRKRPRLR